MRPASYMLTVLLSFWLGWVNRQCEPSAWNPFALVLSGVLILMISAMVFAAAAEEK